MLHALFSIIDMVLQLLVWIVIIQVILSWLVAFNVINSSSNFVRTVVDTLDRLTAPLYRPIRRILPFGKAKPRLRLAGEASPPAKAPKLISAASNSVAAIASVITSGATPCFKASPTSSAATSPPMLHSA